MGEGHIAAHRCRPHIPVLEIEQQAHVPLQPVRERFLEPDHCRCVWLYRPHLRLALGRRDFDPLPTEFVVAANVVYLCFQKFSQPDVHSGPLVRRWHRGFARFYLAAADLRAGESLNMRLKMSFPRSDGVGPYTPL